MAKARQIFVVPFAGACDKHGEEMASEACVRALLSLALWPVSLAKEISETILPGDVLVASTLEPGNKESGIIGVAKVIGRETWNPKTHGQTIPFAVPESSELVLHLADVKQFDEPVQLSKGQFAGNDAPFLSEATLASLMPAKPDPEEKPKKEKPAKKGKQDAAPADSED